MELQRQRRFIRGKEVVFENTAAALVGTTVPNIHKIISKNKARFPGEFLFILTKEEHRLFDTQERYAFPLSGLIMLATLANVEMAVKLMRAYSILRKSHAINLENQDIFDLMLKEEL